MLVSRWKRKVMYDAVRLFGWIAWNRNKNDKYNGVKRVIDTSDIKATMPSRRPGTIETAYRYYVNRKHAGAGKGTAANKDR